MFDLIKLKIFEFLWNNPSEMHSISEISKKTDVSYGATWKTLNEFRKQELVKRIKKKAHLYSLNLDSFSFKIWSLRNSIKKNDLSKIKKYENYFEAMDYLNKKISCEFIVLYGSIARKEANSTSDLDVLILSNKKINTNKISKEIEIKFFVEAKITTITQKELIKFIKEKRLIYQNIWKEGLIWNNEKKFFELMKKLWVN